MRHKRTAKERIGYCRFLVEDCYSNDATSKDDKAKPKLTDFNRLFAFGTGGFKLNSEISESQTEGKRKLLIIQTKINISSHSLFWQINELPLDKYDTCIEIDNAPFLMGILCKKYHRPTK